VVLVAQELTEVAVQAQLLAQSHLLAAVGVSQATELVKTVVLVVVVVQGLFTQERLIKDSMVELE
jgi:hypothetical protein